MMELEPQPHVGQLDDRLAAVDCLETCKHLSLEYTMAALEAANPRLRQVFSQAAQQNIDAADEVYRFMNRRGWYSPTPAQPQQVEQLSQQFHPPGAGRAGMPSQADRRQPVQGGHYGYGTAGTPAGQTPGGRGQGSSRSRF